MDVSYYCMFIEWYLGQMPMSEVLIFQINKMYKRKTSRGFGLWIILIQDTESDSSSVCIFLKILLKAMMCFYSGLYCEVKGFSFVMSIMNFIATISNIS